MAQAYNLTIPHLKSNQKVKDWRVLYTSAVALLEEKQAIQFLPIAVDRSTADQKWASEAAKKETLKAALDELQTRLDGKKTRLVAMTEFFELKPPKSITQRSLSAFFFEALEAGKAAGITFDVIAMKFLQYVPGANKLFNDNEDDIVANMTEAKLVEFFDKVQEKLARKKKCDIDIDVEEVFHVTNDSVDNQMPKWAEDLRADVNALKTSLSTVSSTDSTNDEQSKAFYYKKDGKNFKKQSRAPCSICKKNNHSPKNCYKRVCSKCSGIGHDADKCASRISNKKRNR